MEENEVKFSLISAIPPIPMWKSRVQLGHPIENKSCLYMLVEFNKTFEATVDPKKILPGLNMTPEASNQDSKQCSTIVPKQKLSSFEKLDIYK